MVFVRSAFQSPRVRSLREALAGIKVPAEPCWSLSMQSLEPAFLKDYSK